MTMYLPTLQYQPTFPRDLPSIQGAASNTSILHIYSLDAPFIKLHYWITTSVVLPTFHQYFLDNDYDLFYFTPISSKAACLSLDPSQAITNTISLQHTDSDAPNIDLYSSMPIMSSPPPHPITPTTAPVDHTTALIRLMTQHMHQNVTLMAKIHCQASLTVPKTPYSQTYKIQCPPFPKWYGVPTTKPLLLAQVDNYNAKAYYACISNWSCMTSITSQLSVAISADIISSLPRDLSSMFIKNSRFSSDGDEEIFTGGGVKAS